MCDLRGLIFFLHGNIEIICDKDVVFAGRAIELKTLLLNTIDNRECRPSYLESLVINIFPSVDDETDEAYLTIWVKLYENY